MNYILLILGFILLVVGGEYLVRSSVALSFKFKLSKMMIGLTVVSFATSAPELLVSIQAAFDDFSDVSLGNVIGSNIANIGLVLGLSSMLTVIAVEKDFYRVNWPMMLFMSGLLYLFLWTDLELSRWEGVIFLILIVSYVIYLLNNSRITPIPEEADESLKKTSNFKVLIWLVIGSAALYFGSEWLVDGAVGLSEKFGISQRIISVSIIAVGTSIPELAASIISIIKGEKAISLGNLIGSNIFNIASVLGITAILKPIAVESTKILSNDLIWMIGIAAVTLPLALIKPKNQFTRWNGFILFLGFIIFNILAYYE
jgi:cation:H+ antiporter